MLATPSSIFATIHLIKTAGESVNVAWFIVD